MPEPAPPLPPSYSFLKPSLTSSSSSSNSAFSFPNSLIEKNGTNLTMNPMNDTAFTELQNTQSKEEDTNEKNDPFFSFLPPLEPTSFTEPTLALQSYTTSSSSHSSVPPLDSNSTTSPPPSSPTKKSLVPLSKESHQDSLSMSTLPPRQTHFELRAETERLLRAQQVALPSQTVKRSLEEFLEKRKKAKLSSKDTSSSSNLPLKSIMVELSDSDSDENDPSLNSPSSSPKLKNKSNLSTLEHQKQLRLKMIQQAQSKRKSHLPQATLLANANSSLNDVKNEFANMIEEVSIPNESDDNNSDDNDDSDTNDSKSESYGSMLSSDYDDSDSLEEEVEEEEEEDDENEHEDDEAEKKGKEKEEQMQHLKHPDSLSHTSLITYHRMKEEDEDMNPTFSTSLPFTPMKSTSFFTSSTHSPSLSLRSSSTPSQIQMKQEKEDPKEEDFEDIPRISRLSRSRPSVPSAMASSTPSFSSSNPNPSNWDTFFVASPSPDTSLSPTSKLNQLRQPPISPTLVPSSLFTDTSPTLFSSLPPSPSPPMDATVAAAKFFLDTEAVESDDEDTLFPFPLNSKEKDQNDDNDHDEEENEEDEDKDLEGFITQDQLHVNSDAIRAFMVQQRQEEQHTWLSQLEKDLDLKQQRRFVNANSRWTSSSSKKEIKTNGQSEELKASFLTFPSTLEDFTSTLSITTPSPNARAPPPSSLSFSQPTSFPSLPSSPSSSFHSHFKHPVPMSPTPTTPSSLSSSMLVRKQIPSLPSNRLLKGSFLGKRFDTKSSHPTTTTTTTTVTASSSSSSSSFSSTTPLSVDAPTSGFQTTSLSRTTTGNRNIPMPTPLESSPFPSRSVGMSSNNSNSTKILSSESSLLKVLEDTNET